MELRLGWALDDFQDDGEACWYGDRVERAGGGAAGRTRGKRDARIRCSYLVGADGARSRVRNALGIRHGGVTGVRRDFMGGQMFAVHLRAPRPVPHAAASALLDERRRQRPAARLHVRARRRDRVRLSRGAAADEEAERWGDGRRRSASSTRRWASHVRSRCCRWAPGPPGHSLVATQFPQGRVFIGGDAAHLFTPTGGLGYNTAVEDAVNLGWKLAAVLKGIAPPTLLDSYELERKPLAERNTAYARRFADSIGNFRATPLLEEDRAAGAAERAAAAELPRTRMRGWSSTSPASPSAAATTTRR